MASHCVICGRQAQEKHHLVPGEPDTIDVCVDCGDQIHLLFSRSELRYSYNTIEKLLASERIQKWIKFVRRQNGRVCMKTKK